MFQNWWLPHEMDNVTHKFLHSRVSLTWFLWCAYEVFDGLLKEQQTPRLLSCQNVSQLSISRQLPTGFRGLIQTALSLHRARIGKTRDDITVLGWVICMIGGWLGFKVRKMLREFRAISGFCKVSNLRTRTLLFKNCSQNFGLQRLIFRALNASRLGSTNVSSEFADHDPQCILCDKRLTAMRWCSGCLPSRLAA